MYKNNRIQNQIRFQKEFLVLKATGGTFVYLQVLTPVLNHLQTRER